MERNIIVRHPFHCVFYILGLQFRIMASLEEENKQLKERNEFLENLILEIWEKLIKVQK